MKDKRLYGVPLRVKLTDVKVPLRAVNDYIGARVQGAGCIILRGLPHSTRHKIEIQNLRLKSFVGADSLGRISTRTVLDSRPRQSELWVDAYNTLFIVGFPRTHANRPHPTCRHRILQIKCSDTPGIS